MGPPLSYVFDPCEDGPGDPAYIAHLEAERQLAFDAYLSECIQNKVIELETSYQQSCIDRSPVLDDLKLKYDLGLIQYTLYYYDRAGNLVRTVAPEGVSPTKLGNNWSADHDFETDYTYNALNQAVQQTTPDAGQTQFVYNKEGQLIFSQSAQQLIDGAFSYSVYDNLGRVEETGEETGTMPATAPTGPYTPTGTTLDVTTTTYSQPAALISNYTINGKGQQNLYNRISSVCYDAGVSGSGGGSEVCTYYSYDVHGNVQWLVHFIPSLGYKHIRYEYDLISGNVLKVFYNEGRVGEQFVHKYEYDADNRLLGVETSTDGVIWHNDANYEYYAHGPLKRTELGHEKVQGLDYIYTIEGYLKAINRPKNQLYGQGNAQAAPSDNDLDPDFADDAFTMQLDYYPGDYKGTYIPGQHTVSPSTGLYNGNITAWHTTTQDGGDYDGFYRSSLQSSTFTYDWLNRLIMVNGGTTATATGDYREHFSYDKNGNINTAYRTGLGSYLVDDATYQYSSPNVNNKLMGYTDATNIGGINDLYSTIGSQYTYDADGNLITDSEANTNIFWNVAGKVSSVSGGGKSIQFKYDGMGNRIAKVSGGIETFYIRDAQGNIMMTYRRYHPDPLDQSTDTEMSGYLYGSTRLGSWTRGTVTNMGFQPTGNYNLSIPSNIYELELGDKSYELTDHLGNVRAVVSDKRMSDADGSPDVLSWTDYYSFGSTKFGRNWTKPNTDGSRFGFGGKEQDTEISEGHYNYGARMLDVRLGRFLSLDPMARSYPSLSAYSYVANNPLIFVDPTGAVIEPGSQAVANNLKRKITSKSKELRQELAAIRSRSMHESKSGLKYSIMSPSDKRRVEVLAFRLNKLNNAYNGIKAMEESDKTFRFQSTNANTADLSVSKNDVESNTYTLTYIMGDIGNQIHELAVHGGQIAEGKLSYSISDDDQVQVTAAGELTNYDLEIEAYQTEYSYTGSLHVYMTPPSNSTEGILNKAQGRTGTNKQLNLPYMVTEPEAIDRNFIQGVSDGAEAAPLYPKEVD